MKLGWIGTVAFQGLTDGGNEVVFDLAANQVPPPEFKTGDIVEMVNRPDHPANIAMGMNGGYYEVTHLTSGVKVHAHHTTSAWRLDP